MHAATPSTDAAAPVAHSFAGIVPQEFIAFRLGREEYGINIRKVQELRGYDTVTRIANAPDFIRGVINLRGIIVPIIDLRIRFNLSTPDCDPRIVDPHTADPLTVVIILNIGKRTIGMVVDGVSDVVTLAPEHIKPAPALPGTMDANYLTGLGTLDDRMLILLDIDALLGSAELGLIEKLAA